MPEVTQEVSGRGEYWALGAHCHALLNGHTNATGEPWHPWSCAHTSTLWQGFLGETSPQPRTIVLLSVWYHWGTEPSSAAAWGTLQTSSVSSVSQSLQPASSQWYGSIVSLLFSLKAMRISRNIDLNRRRLDTFSTTSSYPQISCGTFLWHFHVCWWTCWSAKPNPCHRIAGQCRLVRFCWNVSQWK